MISDPNTAKYVGELMLQFLLEMEKSLDVVKKSSAPDESSMYVKAVGNVSFRVVNDVLEPALRPASRIEAAQLGLGGAGGALAMVIRELRVSGYRSVRELRLQLGNVNVLTGPNGCGKSNLYNSVFLLAKVANGDFARVVAKEGGMASLLWAAPRKVRSLSSARTEPVRVAIGVRTDKISYKFVCGLPQHSRESPTAFKLDPEVKEEQVFPHHFFMLRPLIP